MEPLSEFIRLYDHDFWKAFARNQKQIKVPKNQKDREKLITEIYYDLKKREYFPLPARLFIEMEKDQGVPRFVPVFSIRDYCVYYYCVKRLEERIAFNRVENTYGGWTLGGVIRKSEYDEMRKPFFTENSINEVQYGRTSTFDRFAWSKAYGDLNAKLYEYSIKEDYDFVLCMDIANFYDNIRLDLLEQQLRASNDRSYSEVIDVLFVLLNYWNRERNGYSKQAVGLPQDAIGDFSRLLANYYLQSYDEYMYNLCKKYECAYLRYADDQFVFFKSDRNVKYITYKATKRLQLLGLSLNQLKVRTLSTKELIKERSFEIFDILANKTDREDVDRVEEFANRIIDLVDTKGLSNLKNKGFPLLNRLLFSPALYRIEFSKLTKVLGCYLDEEYLVSASSSHFKRIYELLGEGRSQNSFLARLNEISERYIFNYFHYQILDFFENIGEDTYKVETRIIELENL